MAQNNRQIVPIEKIKPNPNNPRRITGEAFDKLVKSIIEFPEMLEAREIVVNTDFVILGGNMRFQACKEAGVIEVPVKIVDWSEEKQREFVIKDNVSGGEWDWDILADEWDSELLDDWGLKVPKNEFSTNEEEKERAESLEESEITIISISLFGETKNVILAEKLTEEETELLLAKIELHGASAVLQSMLGDFRND